jgi:hypothetical protein
MGMIGFGFFTSGPTAEIADALWSGRLTRRYFECGRGFQWRLGVSGSRNHNEESDDLLQVHFE